VTGSLAVRFENTLLEYNRGPAPRLAALIAETIRRGGSKSTRHGWSRSADPSKEQSRSRARCTKHL